MTAEIAVLNKGAIALAADSAGTIGPGGAAKIYNGFNKIMEISDSEPVALMIYGGLDYMGLPIEVLAKEYRRRHGRDEHSRLKGHAQSFFSFLRDEVPATQSDLDTNIARIVVPYFSQLDKRAQRRWLEESRDDGRHRLRRGPALLEEVLEEELAQLRTRDLNPDFLQRAPRPASGHDHVLEGAIDAAVPRATRRHRNLLRQIGRQMLMRGPLSGGRTGMVIAGFGTDDLCPSLEAFETDGIVFGNLKFQGTHSVDIGRHGPHADIVGFAQSDMVGAFLDGVDPGYRSFALQVVERYLDRWVNQLERVADGNPQAPDGIAALRAIMGTVHTEISKELRDHSEKHFREPILNMIRFMPNSELATLAESLIEITSLKRRVSRDRETVGGDVDVAVISRSEGFVWIKRKHYFPADLNPRFFLRAQI